MSRIAEVFGLETLRCAAGAMGIAPQQGGGMTSPQDSEAMNNQQPQMDQDVAAAPYAKLLAQLGYQFMGHDEDSNGNKIGSSFQGQNGDIAFVTPQGSWKHFGSAGQKTASGPDVKSLGQHLVGQTLRSADDKNHHGALKKAGYHKIHTDSDGNSYYKHPSTGKTVTVKKDGSWGSSVGTGRGAGKLQEFLGNEQMADQDPQMMKMKLQQQQLKQQGQQQQQQQARPRTPGTRSSMGTRGR